MNFELDKRNTLEKKDKSNKGSVDEDIKEIIDKINSHPNYFTTSSCSGRIMLIEKPESKLDSRWLFLSHNPVLFEDIKPSIKINFNPIWFKQESAILHVCCRKLEDADKLLKLVKECGFKRAGIITLNPKIVCEIIGSESISTPVAKENILISENYLKILVEEANRKMKDNKKRLDSLLKKLSNL